MKYAWRPNGLIRHAHLTAWIILAVTLVLYIPVAAQGELKLTVAALDAPVTASASRKSMLTGSSMASIGLGSAISVRVNLTNGGKESVTLMRNLNPACGFLSFYLSFGNSEASRFTTTRWETQDFFMKPAPLLPGGAITFETFLFGRISTNSNSAYAEEYLFSSPGVYHLYVRYTDERHGIELRSNTIEVRVADPLPHWEELKRAGILNLIEGRTRSHWETTNSLAQVQSILSDQTNHALKALIQARQREQVAREKLTQ